MRLKYIKIQNSLMPDKFLTLGFFSVSEIDQILLRSTETSLIDQDTQQIIPLDYVLSFNRVILYLKKACLGKPLALPISAYKSGGSRYPRGFFVQKCAF